MHYNTGTQLTLCDIDEEIMLVIDPDTVFWALVPKGEDIDSKIKQEIIPLYSRVRIVEKIEHCNTCAFRNICGAPCPAEVYSMQGKFYNPSPYCEFYEELIRFAFKMIAEDKTKYFLKEDVLNSLGYKYRMEE